VKLQSKGIGRAMKIGKENIVGLTCAIERYISNDKVTLKEMEEEKLLRPAMLICVTRNI
ncbi:hypothetical protein GSQ53_21030, partial [Clostridioides difficile]|nr:hypothetical protein [Clostridioides difficile]